MSSDASVLLGALLDRLGKAQGQALLTRLDRWLTGGESDSHPARDSLDSDRQCVPAESHDRRRHDQERNSPVNPQIAASATPKDWQP
jgi:hypothetical protein